MKKNNKRRHVEIDWPKEHPRQSEFFADTSESEAGELAADLEQRGQQEPIHCLADGTIIRGHRRLKAAKQLGWLKIAAVIRHDLGDATDEDVLNELILDNHMRRQLDDLALARCYRQLKRSYFQHDEGVGGDTRDRLAARLNCGKSGRSLDRLERLLDLPRELQDAISCGKLTKSHGEKILQLSKKSQANLAKALRGGATVEKVLLDFKVSKRPRKKSRAVVGQELLDFLNHNLHGLQRRIEDLDRLQVRGGKALNVLDEAVEFFVAWRDRKRRLHRQSVDAIRAAVVDTDRRTN